MPVFIALYRGINIGGHHSVKMETLRALHEQLMHEQVQSYIQSGNVIFKAKGPASAIAQKVSAAFTKEFGFSARLMLVDAKRWRTIVEENPYAAFAKEKPQSVHVGICDGKPSEKALEALLAKTGGSETFVVGKNMIYLHSPGGYGPSKFAAGMEKACGVPMTVRNWRTMEKIWDLASALE